MPKFDKTSKFGVDGKQKYMEDRHPVLNEDGSGVRKCQCCDSWLAHWQNNSKSKRSKCVYLGCNANAVHGAHIKFYEIDKGRKYPKSWLIPLCAKHNNPSHKNPFYVSARCELIAEKAQRKCGKTTKSANRNNNFEIKVIKKAPKPKCKCKDALEHYQLNAKSKRERCAITPCGKPSKEAYLVKSVDARTDKKLWLAPICSKHASSKKPMFIESLASLVLPDRCNAKQP